MCACLYACASKFSEPTVNIFVVANIATNRQRTLLNVSADRLLTQTMHTLIPFYGSMKYLTKYNCTVFFSIFILNTLTDASWSSDECMESRFFRSFSPDDDVDVFLVASFSRSDFLPSFSRSFPLRSFSFLLCAASKSLTSSSQSRLSAGSQVLSVYFHFVHLNLQLLPIRIFYSFVSSTYLNRYILPI